MRVPVSAPFYPAVAVAWHERRFVRCLHVCHVYPSFCHKAVPPSTWVSSCQFKNAGKAPHWRGAGFPLSWRRVYSVRGWENTPECTARGTPASSAAARSAACPMIHHRFCGFCFLGQAPSELPYPKRIRTDRRKQFKAAQVGSLTNFEKGRRP